MYCLPSGALGGFIPSISAAHTGQGTTPRPATGQHQIRRSHLTHKCIVCLRAHLVASSLRSRLHTQDCTTPRPATGQHQIRRQPLTTTLNKHGDLITLIYGAAVSKHIDATSAINSLPLCRSTNLDHSLRVVRPSSSYHQKTKHQTPLSLLQTQIKTNAKVCTTVTGSGCQFD